MANRNRPILPIRRVWPLYLVATYVVLQFTWWAYLLADLNGQIHFLRMAELATSTLADAEKLSVQAQLEAHLRQRIWMVIGEGAVFFTLLVIGLYAVRRSLGHELELGRQQRNFLLSVTHELRSPIAAIKLSLQTLEKHKLDDVQRSKLYGSALTEANRLQRLVDNVLLAARLESGNLPMHPQAIAALQDIRNILDRHFPDHLHSGRLQLAGPEDLDVICDPEAFNSIIINLTTNALKYSPPSTPITLNLTKLATMVCIRVSDLGAGISNQEKQMVTKKFYRTGQEETRNSKGTGLGLYITAGLITSNNGKLTIADNAPNGTIMEVQLPISVG